MAGRVWIGVLIASLTFVGSVRATDVCGLARHCFQSTVGPLRLRGGGYSLGLRDSIMIAHSFKGEEFGPAQSMHGATYTVDVEFHVKELVADPLSLVNHFMRARTCTCGWVPHLGNWAGKLQSGGAAVNVAVASGTVYSPAY